MCIKHLACNDFSLNVGICIGIFSFLAPSVVTGDATCVLLHSCQAVKCWIRLCLSLWYKYIQWWSYRNVFSKPRQASQPSIPTRVPWRSQQDFLDNCPLDTPLGWLRTPPPQQVPDWTHELSHKTGPALAAFPVIPMTPCPHSIHTKPVDFLPSIAPYPIHFSIPTATTLVHVTMLSGPSHPQEPHSTCFETEFRSCLSPAWNLSVA